jgi:hypothetical protein
MKDTYLVVLFKNRKRKKIIKRYSTEKQATRFFNQLIKDNTVTFERKVENAEHVQYEIGLLSKNSSFQSSLFIVDDYGRNNPVNLENPEYVFLDIKKYKIEELIFDWQEQKKISFDDFIRIYCKSKELKNIFNLNNKICVQINDDVTVFSLKDSSESERFLDTLQSYFYQNNRIDGIFVKDISTPQRKWIYQVMENKGFDKKRLYRLKTTFSKR